MVMGYVSIKKLHGIFSILLDMIHVLKVVLATAEGDKVKLPSNTLRMTHVTIFFYLILLQKQQYE